MKSDCIRVVLIASAGLLIGAAVTTMSLPVGACSCQLFVEVRELQLASASSSNADEVARWTGSAEVYGSHPHGLQVGDLYLDLLETTP
jgi:hypothetical protein